MLVKFKLYNLRLINFSKPLLLLILIVQVFQNLLVKCRLDPYTLASNLLCILNYRLKSSKSTILKQQTFHNKF